MPIYGCEADVRELLSTEIKNETEVSDILKTAARVGEKWETPLSGGEGHTNGLIYGLVQSGKTGVLTAAAAMAVDQGYKTLLILTTDIDPLYEQTLSRIRAALPQIDVIPKTDFKDIESFCARVRRGNCAIVTSKNKNLLDTLVENFKKGRLKGLPTLIIDDEADQASLNTRARKPDDDPSTINALISELRSLFGKNTYLQVTATPQALFLQAREHAFRPKFTILSQPGGDYVGGDDFFSEESKLIREFPLDHVTHLATGGAPGAPTDAPSSLTESLDTFMVGATYKRMVDSTQHCAYLCHVSMRKLDHDHIVAMLRKYKDDLRDKLAARHEPTILRLKAAYDGLAQTHEELKKADFEEIKTRIERYAPGVNIKKVNGETDEDVALQSPYNLFVGGNKLGRGVTIRNLLVSYYGRHPKEGQADTVLQHARMYGYRRKDLGLLRLYLPPQLHIIFKSIHTMEMALRDVIERLGSEEFRALYIENGLRPTRKSVLAPGALGVYSGGSTYNPSQVIRTPEMASSTSIIDDLVRGIQNKSYVDVDLKMAITILNLCAADPEKSQGIWDVEAVTTALTELERVNKEKGAQTGIRIYVSRDRKLEADRRETQGNLDGGEVRTVPDDLPRLFLLRTAGNGNEQAVWWPEIHFPPGAYAFAFAV